MPKNRSANNMGSLRQRPDGRWEGRYSGPDGRQHSVYSMDQGECVKKLRDAITCVDRGAWQEPSKMTAGEWFTIWLRDYQHHNTDRTVNKYRCIVKKYFRPVLGDVRVSKLSSMHARRVVSVLQEKGLTAATVQLYMRVLQACLNSAVEAGLIPENPAARVKLQRGASKPFCVVDRAEIPAFLAAAKSTPYENELVVMLLTGMRAGELRGLQWADVDFDAATLSVHRQLQPKTKGFPRITPPKYNEVRTLHVPPEVVAALRAQRRKQAADRLASGGAWKEDPVTKDLVFRQPDGAPHNEKTLYRSVKAAGAAIGKPDLHPHDLRHSYAIAALRSGANVKTVQHNLGHKTAKMTLDVYAAYTDDSGITDAAKLSDYLRDLGT